MAQASSSRSTSTRTSTTGTKAPTVPGESDHDRVSMLSIGKDGKPDQLDPEMIGDPDAAKAATAEQFRQRAVSAEDVRLRGVTSGAGGAAEDVEQDPAIAELQKAHQSAADAATKAAEATVDALHTGESEKVPETNPAS